MTYRPAGPGTMGGWQMNSNAMNANQRRMFLPQQSTHSEQRGGGGGGGKGDDLRESDTPGLDQMHKDPWWLEQTKAHD